MGNRRFGICRLCALLVALVLMVGIAGAANLGTLASAAEDTWTAYAASAFAAGDGSEGAPYQIADGSQLALLAKSGDRYEGKYFVLTADVDLSAHEWVPVKHFDGYLNGNGRTVSGLRMGTEETPAERTGEDEWGAGLFNVLGGAVTDLTVSGSIYIKDQVQDRNDGAGLIAGRLEGKLDRCVAKGVVAATRNHAYVGGLVGVAVSGATIVNCNNEATVNGSSPVLVNRLGGIAGSVVIEITDGTDILIANCRNAGAVFATAGTGSLVGGIAGCLESSSAAGAVLHIYNCYTAIEMPDNVYGTSTAKGGIVPKITVENGGSIESEYLYAYISMYNEALEVVKTELWDPADVAAQLTENADVLVGSGRCTELLSWLPQEGKQPILGTEYVEGTRTTLKVSVDGERKGSVIVMADETGGDQFAATVSDMIKKGSNVQLSFQPRENCKLTSVQVNGVERIGDLYGHTLTIPVSEATVVTVTFDVEKTVDVDPIYVDPNAESGGDGSEEKPFVTLQEAQARIRQVLAEQPSANLTVYLMGGTYRLEETLKLTWEDSSLGRVTFKSVEGENPVITSGQPTGLFTKVEGKDYYSFQLPESVKVNGQYPMSHDLYVNGHRATLARTEYMKVEYGFANPVMDEDKPAYIDYAENSMYVQEAALAGVHDEDIPLIELNVLNQWKHQMFHLAERDASNVRNGQVNIKLNQNEVNDLFEYDRTLKSMTGCTYWLQNHLCFLDEPGEYYYDQVRGVIYYYPYENEDMNTADIRYATLDKLIELDHAANFTFDGIAFSGTTANWITEHGLPGQLSATLYAYIKSWGDCGGPIPCGAIFGDYAEGIKVLNCSFEELGGSAIVFQYGTKDLEITGNCMKDLAIAGIHIGVAQVKWNQDGMAGQAENVIISNNYITNVGTTVCNAIGISIKRCENLTINHNKIIHTPYSAIAAGWGFDISTNADFNKNLVNVEIAYNYIEDYMFRGNDGGGIYVCGANEAVASGERFNRIHDNYIRGGAHNGINTGIYHDGSASNWMTYHNFVDDISSIHGSMIFQDDVKYQNTHNITAKDNYSTTSTINQSGDLDRNGDPRNILLENNIVFANRSEVSEEAWGIMHQAGLEERYALLEKPMDVELRIADDTMHYMIYIKKETPVTVKLEITNNGLASKEFVFSSSDLPDGVTLAFNNGEAVTVDAGQTVTVEGTFVITDKTQLKHDGDHVVTITVTDETGRKTEYPRILSVQTTPRKPPVEATEPGTEITPPAADAPSTSWIWAVVVGAVILMAAATVCFVIYRKKSANSN